MQGSNYLDDSLQEKFRDKLSKFSIQSKSVMINSIPERDEDDSNQNQRNSDHLIQNYFSQKLKQYQLNMHDLQADQESIRPDPSKEEIIEMGFKLEMDVFNLSDEEEQKPKSVAKKPTKKKKARNRKKIGKNRKAQNEVQMDVEDIQNGKISSQKSQEEMKNKKDSEMGKLISRVQSIEIISNSMEDEKIIPQKEQTEKRVNIINKNKRQKVLNKRKVKNNEKTLSFTKQAITKLDVSNFTIEMQNFEFPLNFQKKLAEDIDKEVLKNLNELIKKNAQQKELPELVVRDIYKEYGEKKILLKSICGMEDENQPQRKNYEEDDHEIGEDASERSEIKEKEKEESQDYLNELQKKVIEEVKNNPEINTKELVRKFPEIKKEKIQQLLTKLMQKLEFQTEKSKITRISKNQQAKMPLRLKKRSASKTKVQQKRSNKSTKKKQKK